MKQQHAWTWHAGAQLRHHHRVEGRLVGPALGAICGQIQSEDGILLRNVNPETGMEMWLAHAFNLPVFVLYNSQQETVLSVYDHDAVLESLTPAELETYLGFMQELKDERDRYVARQK